MNVGYIICFINFSIMYNLLSCSNREFTIYYEVTKYQFKNHKKFKLQATKNAKITM